MDTNTMIVLVIAIFAVLVLAAFFIYRQRAKVNINGPHGIGLGLDASNDQTTTSTGAIIEDAKTTEGNVRSVDETGSGAVIRRAEAKGDIEAINRNPTAGNGPKAKR
jgi:hypothetical protein